MINLSNKEEMFFMISAFVNDKDKAIELTSKMSVYIHELYRERIKKDIDLFDNVSIKHKKTIYNVSYGSPREIDHSARLETLQATKKIWEERDKIILEEMIEDLK